MWSPRCFSAFLISQTLTSKTHRTCFLLHFVMERTGSSSKHLHPRRRHFPPLAFSAAANERAGTHFQSKSDYKSLLFARSLYKFPILMIPSFLARWYCVPEHSKCSESVNAMELWSWLWSFFLFFLTCPASFLHTCFIISTIAGTLASGLILAVLKK